MIFSIFSFITILVEIQYSVTISMAKSINKKRDPLRWGPPLDVPIWKTNEIDASVTNLLIKRMINIIAQIFTYFFHCSINISDYRYFLFLWKFKMMESAGTYHCYNHLRSCDCRMMSSEVFRHIFFSMPVSVLVQCNAWFNQYI